MHYHFVEDDSGQIVDLVPFCCDSCNRQWCETNGVEYGGWNGAQEGSNSVEYCANCGVVAGGNYQCECQCENVVANRFRSTDGERCEHGNWIQVLESYLDK